MGYLRQFADAGDGHHRRRRPGTLEGRQGAVELHGEGLSLASFRETSELEYGADDAFILTPADDGEGEPPSRVVLRHLKSRHGETRDIALDFDRQAPAVHAGRARRADARPTPASSRRPCGPLWNKTPPARDDDGDEPMSTANGKATTGRRKTTKRRSALRFEVLNAFVDEGMADLTPHEAAVWLVLFRDTKPDGIARTAVDDIARRAGIGRRTVLRALKRLEAASDAPGRSDAGGLTGGRPTYRVFPFPAPDEWG